MNKSLTTKKVAVLTLLSCMLTALSACSGSGGSSSSGGNGTDNGDVSNLQIITPKTIYSKSSGAGSGYVVINNPTATAVKNIHYTLSNQIGSGSSASLDPTSAANCATVAAYSQCNVKVTVAAGAVAGSLGLEVSNDSSLLGKLAKAAKATTPTPTVGIEQAAYNNLSGADGITLSYYHTVINGTPYILVSGLVASANIGSFNNIVLVDSNNNEIPNQQSVGDIGSTQGSTFNILLPVPAGSNATQTIKIQTQQIANGQTTVVSTASATSTLTTKENIGIAEMLPGAIYLSESNPEQIITFLNIGDAVAQLQQLVSNHPNVEVIFSPASLGSGSTATATLKLKDKTVAATTGAVTLTYNNGQTQTSTSGTVDQNVNPTPSPSPSPTPTPPSPAPTPVAGLTAVLSPDNDFFKTTEGAAVSRQLTLTNTGNTDENAIVLTLPANFTISSGTNPATTCTVTQPSSPATINNTLASGANCTVTVTYSNSSIVNPAQTDNITINYNYNGSTPAPTPTVAAVSYQVTQSTAILTLTKPWDPYNFINISGVSGTDSATQTFTLYNSGEIDATNVVDSINPTSIFTILTNYGSTIAAGTSGNLDLQFGPSSSFGSYNTTLTVTYDDYPTHAATPVTVDITGSVSNAIAYLKTIDATGFAGGDGQTPATAYALETNTNGQITLTYENKGNEDAQNFRLTTGTISSKLTGTPFTLVTDGCNLDSGGITLTAAQTCDEVLQYSPTAVGATTLPLDTSNWEFSYSDTHGDYTYNSAPIYFEAYTPPQVTIASTTSWQTMMGSAYAFKATITDGSSTVTPAVTGVTGNTISPASCSLNSAAPATSSCTFIVTPYTGTGNYSFWDPANIANSTDVNNPANAYVPNSIALIVNADNNAVVNNGAVQPFTISGTVIASYVYLPQTGQTPTAPLTATAGMDGYSHTGIPWAYVSSGSTAPNPRFTDNGCDITDNLTGLIWVRNLNAVNSGSTLDWNTALSTAAAGTWCGQSAGTWRVPNINELASLINYRLNNQAFNWLNVTINSGGAGFSGVQGGGYWTSSSYADSNPQEAWFIHMGNGNFLSGNKSDSSSHRLFPVRGQ